jgi:ribosomal protein L1
MIRKAASLPVGDRQRRRILAILSPSDQKKAEKAGYKVVRWAEKLELNLKATIKAVEELHRYKEPKDPGEASFWKPSDKLLATLQQHQGALEKVLGDAWVSMMDDIVD